MRHHLGWAFLALVFGAMGAAGAAQVTIDPDRMLVVDGRRTFVIGLYENPGNDAVLDEVARSGFNLVRASGNKAALDRLQIRGLHAWINLGGHVEVENPEAGEKPIKEIVDACASHPALMVWEARDEMVWTCLLDAFGSPEHLLDPEKLAKFIKMATELNTRLIEGYKILKRLDPNHPLWMNHAAGNSTEMLASFARGADIVGCDIYPLMPYPTHPVDISRSFLAAVGNCTARMQLTAPEKPVWMVLQGVGWGDFKGPIFALQLRPSQQPTLEESRFMAYDAIARGARGVLYWGTDIITKDCQLWKDILKTARELADNQPLLTAPDAPIKPKTDMRLFGLVPWNIEKCPIGVPVLGKVVNAKVCWIIVNEFPAPISYTLDGLADLEGLAYTDQITKQGLTVKNGALSGNLPRYGIHILRPAG